MSTFQTIGAVIATILAAFQLVDKFSTVRRAYSWVLQHLPRIRPMLKDWQIMRKYHPNYEINSCDAVVVENRIELPIEIVYTSGIDDHVADLKCESILVDMSNDDLEIRTL